MALSYKLLSPTYEARIKTADSVMPARNAAKRPVTLAVAMRTTTVSLLVAVSLVLSGCVTTSLTSDVDSNADLSALRSFLVVKLPADNRGIEDLIANELNRRGMTATAVDFRPSQIDADALVTYQDKWMWDITMYMLELNVEIRDPRTNYVLASARSYRTSLARKSPEGMVAEVIGKLLNE